MAYLVMEFVDRDFEVVDTLEEAINTANYYQDSIKEYAKDKGEWPRGSRIIIAKLVEDRGLLHDGESNSYYMNIDKLEKEYQSREYCRDIDCGTIDTLDSGSEYEKWSVKHECNNCGAYHFHYWLKENGYKIVKES